jgi:hypothetical protein
MSDGISDMEMEIEFQKRQLSDMKFKENPHMPDDFKENNVVSKLKPIEKPPPITGIWVSNNRRRMREKIIDIIGAGMEPERAECKADEIINLYNEIHGQAMAKNKHCSPFCDGWHEYLKLIIK